MRAPLTYRERLIAARRRLGLSQRGMAQMMMTPRQTYAQWEAGTRRTPGVAVAYAESIRATSPTSLRGRLLRLTQERFMSAEELAAALRCDEQQIMISIWLLRRVGWPVRVRHRVKRGAGRPKAAPSERNLEIWRARRDGQSVTAIAATMGLTKQRISEICASVDRYNDS